MSFHIAHLPVDVVGVLESTWEDDNNDSADAPNVVLHNRDDELPVDSNAFMILICIKTFQLDERVTLARLLEAVAPVL